MVASWQKNGGSPKSMNPVKLAQNIKVIENLYNRAEICGAPVLSIEVSSDQSNAFLAARLCDL
jgi:hypothetical protein